MGHVHNRPIAHDSSQQLRRLRRFQQHRHNICSILHIKPDITARGGPCGVKRRGRVGTQIAARKNSTARQRQREQFAFAAQERVSVNVIYAMIGRAHQNGVGVGGICYDQDSCRNDPTGNHRESWPAASGRGTKHTRGLCADFLHCWGALRKALAFSNSDAGQQSAIPPCSEPR